MAEPDPTAFRPTDPVGRGLLAVTSALAIFGGLLCGVMAALVTVSVIGRYLYSAPIPGDYDIVGIMNGCAVFAFLPYCMLTRGNVMVDFFTAGAPPRIKAILDAIGSTLFLIVAIMFTWRMYFGMLDFMRFSEVIAAYNFYRWWTIPFAMFCMVLLIVTIAYSLVQDIAKARTAPPSAAG